MILTQHPNRNWAYNRKTFSSLLKLGFFLVIITKESNRFTICSSQQQIQMNNLAPSVFPILNGVRFVFHKKHFLCWLYWSLYCFFISTSNLCFDLVLVILFFFLFNFFLSILFLVMMGIKLRSLHMLGKHSTTVPHSQPNSFP
jgi:hypothetical protein